MTKPEKSQLVRELEEQLKPDEYSYHHEATSAFLMDVIAAVRRVPLSGLSNFSDLVSKFTEINDLYHHYGRCDYIFGSYNVNPSVKDTKRMQRCSTTPMVRSSVKLPTPIPKDVTTFWSSSQNKVLLEILICSFLREMSLEKRERANTCPGLSLSRSQNLCCYIQRY